MFGLKRFRREIYAEINQICEDYNQSQFEVIGRLQKEVELLRANQKSDAEDWWVEKHGCWLSRFGDGIFTPGGLIGIRDFWQYRTPDTLEWREVGPDFTDAIAEIEAEEG